MFNVVRGQIDTAVNKVTAFVAGVKLTVQQLEVDVANLDVGVKSKLEGIVAQVQAAKDSIPLQLERAKVDIQKLAPPGA